MMKILSEEDFKYGIKDPSLLAKAKERYILYIDGINNSTRIRSVINSELELIGINEDFANFTNSITPQKAFPVLAKHIISEDMPSLEMGILARCFAQPDAHEYWNLIKEKLDSKKSISDDDSFKQGLAVALGQMCSTKEELADLYEIIENRDYGFVRALMTDKVKRAGIGVFQELFERLVEHDEAMRLEILSWRSYWKKRNPELLERWKGWKPSK